MALRVGALRVGAPRVGGVRADGLVARGHRFGQRGGWQDQRRLSRRSDLAGIQPYCKAARGGHDPSTNSWASSKGVMDCRVGPSTPEDSVRLFGIPTRPDRSHS